MRKILVAASISLVAALAAVPSNAAVNTVVAGPGAFAAGYATPRVVVANSQDSTFVNADPVGGAHNVVSDKLKANGQPVFASALVPAGGTAVITGLKGLAPGDYTFYCAPHKGTMTGTITVVAG